ncbi:metallo-oxidoreductase [Psychromonas marina]|uniref:Metallo-oxidoreductase n=1 Tax=Psychromonas marina TaxID=88364 RepID=A0ABQ6DX79_9GAMM|nr:multicopper oxidase family protein [Psychromonas marina]GLS89747.1 metallo-oxidoreductase [Psychromonas marina]
MPLSRRRFLTSALLLPASALLPRISLASPEAGFDYVLTAQQATLNITAEGATDGFGFDGQFPAPVLHATQGKKIRIKFINLLTQPTTIHWHGLRIPIEMDGVPFLSQPPIKPGEFYIYEFTPPDAGTFWYHPHVNSLEQLGKGLVGAFIVNEPKKQRQQLAFDQDIPLLLKNWHLDDQGQWLPLSTPRQSARMGTPGRIETINGLQAPQIKVKAGSLVRLRFLNVDNTVMYRIVLPKGLDAKVIAIDGNAVSTPFTLKEAWAMGPGMRLDIAFIAPSAAEQVIEIKNRQGKLNFNFFTLITEGEASQQAKIIPTLPASVIPVPDLKNAKKINFTFEWEGAITPADKLLKGKHDFWIINKRAWEGMNKQSIPAPLVKLELGKSYIFNLRNVTQYHHPIHLHGHTWTVLKSNKRDIHPQEYHTDTVLLGKNETVQVAFVADNPGRWMYHCHVIEHMKTGLMGYIEVS